MPNTVSAPPCVAYQPGKIFPNLIVQKTFLFVWGEFLPQSCFFRVKSQYAALEKMKNRRTK